MVNQPTGIRFGNGQTAEDFANAVATAVKEGKNPVQVQFEDFTVPDALVMQATTEIQGIRVTYAELLLGALDYFHKLKPKSTRAVPTPGIPLTQPYSMSLEMGFENEQSGS